MEQLCVRITWTNRSEGKSDLGVNQYRQYRITLKIKSTLQDFIILLKNTISLSLSLELRASVDFFTVCRYEFLLALLSLRKKRDY